MLYTAIITRSEVQLSKQISSSTKDNKINQIILEAQLQDLRTLLGERLFNAVLKDVQDTGDTNGTIYTDLLNGGEYLYNDITYYHAGIKAVLANYVYGRYIMWGDVIDNPFGATIKLNNNSKPIDKDTKKSFYQENRNFAFNIWVDVRKFLIRTQEPLFISVCSAPKRGFKMRKIG